MTDWHPVTLQIQLPNAKRVRHIVWFYCYLPKGHVRAHHSMLQLARRAGWAALCPQSKFLKVLKKCPCGKTKRPWCTSGVLTLLGTTIHTSIEWSIWFWLFLYAAYTSHILKLQLAMIATCPVVLPPGRVKLVISLSPTSVLTSSISSWEEFGGKGWSIGDAFRSRRAKDFWSQYMDGLLAEVGRVVMLDGQ